MEDLEAESSGRKQDRFPLSWLTAARTAGEALCPKDFMTSQMETKCSHRGATGDISYWNQDTVGPECSATSCPVSAGWGIALTWEAPSEGIGEPGASGD